MLKFKGHPHLLQRAREEVWKLQDDAGQARSTFSRDFEPGDDVETMHFGDEGGETRLKQMLEAWGAPVEIFEA